MSQTDGLDARSSADGQLGRAFRAVAGQLAGGVTVVIALARGEPHATTATAFVPVSFEPPLVAVFFATGSRMAAWLREAERFSVSMLAAADAGPALRFARAGRPSGWAGLPEAGVVRSAGGAPVLAAALAWVECARGEVAPMGDHTCFTGRVEALGRRTDAEPLVYYRGRFRELGATLAPAPWLADDELDWSATW